MKATSIQQLSTTRPDLYAFRIGGTVSRDDMAELATFMNNSFDAHDDKVDMLLVFEDYEGAEPGASLSWEALKSRAKAVTNVNRYVVAGAPDAAQEMIDTLGNLLPVKAETYDDPAQAWEALDAKTNLTSTHMDA